MDDEEVIDLQTIAAHERFLQTGRDDLQRLIEDDGKEEEKAAEADPSGIVAVSLDGEPVPDNGAEIEALNTRRAKQRRRK